jgi:Family of unknown function (DUF5696)
MVLFHQCWKQGVAMMLVLLAAIAAGAAPGPLTIENANLRVSMNAETGQYEILDKSTGVNWKSNPEQARFAMATLGEAASARHVDLAKAEAVPQGDSIRLTYRPDAASPEALLRIQIHLLSDGHTVELGYTADDHLHVQSLDLLDNALWATAAEEGYVLVPARMGLMIPATPGKNFQHTFGTYDYEGCHMEMLGVVKQGSAALLTWDDPNVAAMVKSGPLRGAQVISPTLRMEKTARALRITFLGHGDYMTVGQAYRRVAEARGLVVPWKEKIPGNPERAKLLGAINFKLWALLDREMNAASTQQKVLKIDWTFEEAAQVAEHLKNDLKLDRVLFIMGGWTHRGYDNQHPDVMPPNPECGGAKGLEECARRVRKLGYLLCLHDNYQDIYRDSPSWNEDLIMKRPDGSLAKGGVWWGGHAYLTCSKEALGLAERPQNLPAVKALTHANSYFIDTTYASGLQECFDPKHPLTKADDLYWKNQLSDYARQEFGIFGSEDGREWAIPHSDFFEGLAGVDGGYYHDRKLLPETGGIPVPLFEIVYRDTEAVYGKYGFDIFKSADYVLYHLRIGRTLNYHDVPEHLYWQKAPAHAAPAAVPGATDPALFTRAEGGWAAGLHPFDRFVKNTYEILSPLNLLTAEMPMTKYEFLTSDYKVTRTVFGDGPDRCDVVVNDGSGIFEWESATGGKVKLPPQGFVIDSPTFVAFRALKWNGLTYRAAPLFTLRSLDGSPLASSKQIRIFHAFGDPRVKIGGNIRSVEKEAVVAGE